MQLPSRLRKVILAVSIVAPLMTLPATQAHAGVFISVGFAPPALPVYVQPPLPHRATYGRQATGRMAMRGTIGFREYGFRRRERAFCGRRATGDSEADSMRWHPGYWGPHVGFYGGVNYGFGYGGVGFFGGEWRGGVFAYNRAVANFGGVHVTNVYEDRTVIEHNTIVNTNHVSFNGGAGIQARPSPKEIQAEHEHHMQPTANQMQHESIAAQDRCSLRGESWTAGNDGGVDIEAIIRRRMQQRRHILFRRPTGRRGHYNPNTARPIRTSALRGLRTGQMTSGEAARADGRNRLSTSRCITTASRTAAS